MGKNELFGNEYKECSIDHLNIQCSKMPKMAIMIRTAHSKTVAHPPATYNSAPPFFQPRLTVNTPGDAYEQEADALADQVMQMRNGDAPVVQRMTMSSIGKVQRQCATCAAEDQEELQRKETCVNDVGGHAAPPIVSDVLSSGGGQAMDGGTRQFMESRFGQDFRQVRIHTDSRAAESASAIQARAYTSGRDIVFGQGEYQPSNDEGKRLLAHELVHVGQQKGESKIQRAINEGDISAGTQQFSTNCGWIDWPHADPRNVGRIVADVRRARAGTVIIAEWPGRGHHAWLTVEILANMNEQNETLQNSVALGIYQELARVFEQVQSDVDYLTFSLRRSSFSIEDLPSDQIAFYMHLRGFTQNSPELRTAVCRLCWCWNRRSSLQRFQHDRDRGYLDNYNYQFQSSGNYRAGRWPTEFEVIRPEQAGTYWRVSERRSGGLWGTTSDRGILPAGVE
jgi:hypothetical protein